MGPYRVSDVGWSVEVEGNADVRHLLVGEKGEICPFESDGFGVIWKGWKGVQWRLERWQRANCYLADKVSGKAGLDLRWPFARTVQFMYSRFGKPKAQPTLTVSYSARSRFSLQ